MTKVTPETVLADCEIEERFVRAGGPGGQHVNKTSTAVQLRFDAANCSALPEHVRRRLLALAGSRATADGAVVIEAHEHRSQEKNREAARARLAALLERAMRPPKPRRPTRPTRASRVRRLESKRRRGKIKRGRGPLRPPQD